MNITATQQNETAAAPDSSRQPESTKQPKVPSLRERVREEMSRSGLSQRKLAEETGLTAPSLTRWFADKSKGPEEESVTTRLSAWFEAARDVAEPVGRVGDFVPTASAQRIVAALAFARRVGDMACIYGGPGVGKTRSIRHFRSKFPETTWVATMTPASSGLVSALEVVADAVGVSDFSGGARRISSAIRRQVEDRGGLIIIDEAQHLSMSAVEELRSIHDACGVGLALVGNETAHARLTGGSRATSYAQIFSRIGMRIFVPKPEESDVEALVKHLGVKDRDAIAFLHKLAQRPGALRGIVKAVKLAAEYGAERRGTRDVARAVTLDTLRDAVRTLGAEV